MRPDRCVTSTSGSPDLDWSQVSETVRMLDLAIAQISMAMHEGEDSVASLSASFTGMVGNVQRISEVAEAADLADGTASEAILEQCGHVSAGMQHSIVAFQFYDRLSQRLDHVREALGRLGGLVAEPARLYNPGEWHKLQQQIRHRYTLSGEQQMFDALLAGASVQQALLAARSQPIAEDSESIELF